MPPKEVERRRELEVIVVPSYIDAIEEAKRLIESDPESDYCFLVDIDGTLSQGVKAILMKLPGAHHFIKGNDFISDVNVEALGELYQKNVGGVAIITNRVEEDRIWKSERLLLNLREKLFKFGLEHLRIFTDTDRMVPESIRSIFKKPDRFEPILDWVMIEKRKEKSVKICILSDLGPEAITESIFMSELLKRIPNSQGVIIQISKIRSRIEEITHT